MGDIAGISGVGMNASVVIGLYNNHGLFKRTSDIFNASKTSAVFRNLRYAGSSVWCNLFSKQLRYN